MLLSASQIAEMTEHEFQHPLNPRATRQTRSLGDASGLSNLGVHLVRLEPGRESTEFHRHLIEEECVYVLSGQGVAEIGSDTFDVGPGDYMGFAAGSDAHSLKNTGDEDLVCLVFGQRGGFDICDYPRIGKRIYRLGVREQLVDLPASPD